MTTKKFQDLFLHDMAQFLGTLPCPMSFELCHTKTGLKIFVSVLPKEGLAGNRLVGCPRMHLNYLTKLCICPTELHGYFVIFTSDILYYIGVIHVSKEGLARLFFA